MEVTLFFLNCSFKHGDPRPVEEPLIKKLLTPVFFSKRKFTDFSASVKREDMRMGRLNELKQQQQSRLNLFTRKIIIERVN